MLTLIYFILILGIIVLVHEFGHFIFAKLFGVYVYEFSIGMGPKIFSRKDKKNETTYCIRAIPVGGYVQLAGEEVDDDKKIPKNRKMYAKPAWQRFLIMFFGAGNNFILAFLLLFFYALIWQAPNMDPVIAAVTTDSPSEIAGLESGDKILEINRHSISTIDDVQVYITLNSNGEEVEFRVEKENGQIEEYHVTPKVEKEGDQEVYRFGLTLKGGEEKGFVASLKYAVTKFGAMMKQMVIVVKSLVTGALGVNNLNGPVGIYSIVGETSSAGIKGFFQLIALLSVNVGFINLLPLPAFDGGRILFLIIEKIKGSPISSKVENIIHSIGFILLMILMLYVTFNDILRLF